MTGPIPQGQKRRSPIRAAAALLALIAAAGLAVSQAATLRQGPLETRPASPQAPAAERPVEDPVRITIPSIGADARIVRVGLRDDGAMQTPEFGLAGWYEPGPRPGDPGPAVVVAHVDSKAGPDVFYHLRKLKAGEKILVTDAAGSVHGFSVEHLEQVPKDRLPAQKVWASTGKPVLRLITCGGRFNRTTRHYDDNIIVYASPAR